MQLVILQKLSFDKVDQMSGAGLLSFVGDATVGAVKAFSGLFDMSVISSVDEVFNTVDLTPIHQLADTLDYGVFKGVTAVGGLLSGDTSRIDYHYDTEWI